MKCTDQIKKILGDYQKIDNIINLLKSNGFKLTLSRDYCDDGYYDRFIRKYYFKLKDEKFNYIFIEFRFINNKQLMNIKVNFEFGNCSSNREQLIVYNLNELEQELINAINYIKKYQNNNVGHLLKEVKELLKENAKKLENILIYLKLNNFEYIDNYCLKKINNEYSFLLQKDNKYGVDIGLIFNKNGDLERIHVEIFHKFKILLLDKVKSFQELEKIILEFV